MLQDLLTEIDSGEAEAIALSIELEVDLLIIDESKGRSIARSLGVQTTGLLGVLIEAKRKGLIEVLKPLMDELINDIGFYIDNQLYNRVLVLVDE